MSPFNKVKELAHTIKARLYDNNLREAKSKYVARPEIEGHIGIDEVIDSGIARGDIIGNSWDAKLHVRGFLRETVRLLLAGYSVNLFYFHLSPSITGTFDSPHEPFDKKKHGITIRFYIQGTLRRIIEEEARVVIQGLANTQGFIEKIYDISSGLFDEVLTPGHSIRIIGSRLKLLGDGTEEVGVFFLNALGQRFKTLEISTNKAGLLMVRVPDNLPAGFYTVGVVTQYLKGNKLLKKAHVISSPVRLEVKG
ncbi:hypothetical protein Barb6XT_00977 [Bacteroidales bacterium Barb6XT]|nr:hypothetical protein Barb6XT_00977 [Bacteroidales bacterium Barb6XT]